MLGWLHYSRSKSHNCGFCCGVPGTGKYWAHFSLAVHPLYQNRGIGSALLKEIIDVFRKFNAVEVVLEVRLGNLKARKFYESHGFEETGIAEKYYNDGRMLFDEIEYHITNPVSLFGLALIRIKFLIFDGAPVQPLSWSHLPQILSSLSARGILHRAASTSPHSSAR